MQIIRTKASTRCDGKRFAAGAPLALLIPIDDAAAFLIQRNMPMHVFATDTHDPADKATANAVQKLLDSIDPEAVAAAKALDEVLDGIGPVRARAVVDAFGPVTVADLAAIAADVDGSKRLVAIDGITEAMLDDWFGEADDPEASNDDPAADDQVEA